MPRLGGTWVGPASFARPNPAIGDVRLWLTLTSGGRVALDVYDVGGRKVRSLEEGFLGAGMHELGWDRRDASGRTLPAGVYLVNARTASDTRVARVAVIR